MANPVFVDCTKDAWTKVATAVMNGVINKFSRVPYGYLQTFKTTGSPAPTLISEGIPALMNDDALVIASASSIDVYIYAINAVGRNYSIV